MDEKRELLRHFLAALAYRTQKALRGSPPDFAEFQAGAGVRTPRELVRHMTSVLGYARSFFVGGIFRPEPLETLAAEVERFHGVLADLAGHLAQGTPLRELTLEQLLQGPLADAMTHAGQLAMLRRLAGSPVPSENFLFAEVSPDALGVRQPLPAAPTPAWIGKMVHLAWRLTAWWNRRRRGAPVRTTLMIPAAAALVGIALPGPGRRDQSQPTYEVYAVRYATIPAFPVRALVAGADSARRLDIAMMVWVLRGPAGRVVLVDAGFYRDTFIQQWHPADFVRPSDALAPLGIRAEDVTDIIISHVHWDHLDGADLFPRAQLWIQRAEYEYYVGAAGEVLHRGIDPLDAAMLARLRAAGRVTLVEGDDREVLPGIRVYTGGRHTWASQFVGIHTRAGTAVVASDNLYLYENLERHRPIAQTLDSISNLAAQARMETLASAPRLIVPGHDPAVFTRFPAPGRGVARIE